MNWKLAVICALGLAPLAASAQPNFAGKTVTIVVGYKPGGGYDATARMLARHLPNHLPGKPTVIVQNMPGGNSIIAANHMYAVAKPDGLTIGTFNRNLPIARARSMESGLEQLPVDESFAPTPRAKAIMALRSAPEVIARPYVLPPNTPADIVKLYRDAFAATIKDPALVAEATKAQFDLDYTAGEEAVKILKEVLSQPKDIVDEFSKYIKFGE